MFFRNATKSKSDEELMHLVKGGDDKALTELYIRYSKLMLRYFHRMLWKDDNKSQDFLHDLFMKIIERPENFDGSRKFSTWFYSVAHNMCKNEYRKESFRRAAHDHLQPAERIESTVHEQMDHELFVKIIEKEMTRWSEDDRSLFVFRHELEMTFAEIAAVLNCPEGTVKSRWFYLRKGLALQFQEFQITVR